MKRVKILGIDPGTKNCGYAVIEKIGRDLKLMRSFIMSWAHFSWAFLIIIFLFTGEKNNFSYFNLLFPLILMTLSGMFCGLIHYKLKSKINQNRYSFLAILSLLFILLNLASYKIGLILHSIFIQ